MSLAPALEIRSLTKRFGRKVAVDGVDLTVERGEVLALLGPNGAGKTTTIRCVVGLAKASSGTVTVAGHDTRSAPLAAKAAIGFVPDRAWFYPKVSGRELLRYVASVRRQERPDERIAELLARFRLTDAADALTESYSHGMRQRLALCAALLGDPTLFITDEPMVGLDVNGHREVKRLFQELKGAGRAVILTTHTLAVAEEVADRIAVVDHGKLIALGSLEEIRAVAHGAADASLEELFLRLTEEGEKGGPGGPDGQDGADTATDAGGPNGPNDTGAPPGPPSRLASTRA